MSSQPATAIQLHCSAPATPDDICEIFAERMNAAYPGAQLISGDAAGDSPHQARLDVLDVSSRHLEAQLSWSDGGSWSKGEPMATRIAGGTMNRQWIADFLDELIRQAAFPW